MSSIPSPDACRAILDAADCSHDIVDHVEAVARLAVALAEHAPEADVDLVRAGALLHDVGRSVSHGIEHVVQGVIILQAAGVDDAVVRVVQRHVGAGLEDEEVRDLGWPLDRPDDYIPQTLEERIVAHADNLTFGTDHRRLADAVAKLNEKGLTGQAERVRALHARLADELGVDPDDVSAGLDRR